jgi:signal transduction histidine kinase
LLSSVLIRHGGGEKIKIRKGNRASGLSLSVIDIGVEGGVE